MPYKNHVISTYNERLTSGFRPPNRPDHTGMDFTDADRLELKQDVKVLAFEDGVVVFAGMSSSSAGMGNYIDIRHEFKSSAEGNKSSAEGNSSKKYLTRYCHFKYASPFKTGQTVKKGDVIGVMGMTGNSTGIHLHFGIKENSVSWDSGTWVNPEPYLTGEKDIRAAGNMRAVEPVKQIQSPTIDVNNLVSIKSGAVYGGLTTTRGKSIPHWVIDGCKYTVSAITTRYDEMEVLLKEINSWVAVKYLICIV